MRFEGVDDDLGLRVSCPSPRRARACSTDHADRPRWSRRAATPARGGTTLSSAPSQHERGDGGSSVVPRAPPVTGAVLLGSTGQRTDQGVEVARIEEQYIVCDEVKKIGHAWPGSPAARQNSDVRESNQRRGEAADAPPVAATRDASTQPSAPAARMPATVSTASGARSSSNKCRCRRRSRSKASTSDPARPAPPTRSTRTQGFQIDPCSRRSARPFTSTSSSEGAACRRPGPASASASDGRRDSQCTGSPSPPDHVTQVGSGRSTASSSADAPRTRALQSQFHGSRTWGLEPRCGRRAGPGPADRARVEAERADPRETSTGLRGGRGRAAAEAVLVSIRAR